LRSKRPAASIGRTRKAKGRAVRATTRSHSAKHHAQIVCGHLGDNWNGESDGLRHRGDRFEVSQAPGRAAIAKAPIEGLVAWGRCEAFAYVRTVEIERRSRREYGGRPLINPSVASQCEMWIMLMQMIPISGRDRPNWTSRRHPHEIQFIADEALAAFVTPIAPTRSRLSAQTTSRLNQLFEMNLNPSHS
jgi:hypothetical protein